MGTAGSRSDAAGGAGGEHKAARPVAAPATAATAAAAAAGHQHQGEYTAQQIRMLMQRGLKPDMALLPFQMKRMQVGRSRVGLLLCFIPQPDACLHLYSARLALSD